MAKHGSLKILFVISQLILSLLVLASSADAADQPPAITSATGTTFTVGTLGTFTVTTTGSPTVTSITKTGALPSGVTFVDNGDGTATLSGTADAGTGGSYPLSITASNGILPDAVQSFTLTVNQSPAITSRNVTTYQIGKPGTFTVTTSGNPAVTSITKTGAMPSGVTFVDNGNGTATLSGTPDAGTTGTYPLSITASSGLAPDAVQSFTLTIIPANSGSGKFVFSRAGTGCVVMNSDGSYQKFLDDSFPLFCAYPDWSPDGNKIAFVGSEGGAIEIFVMNADGTGITKLTNFPATAGQYPSGPRWSPDGSKILFYATHDNRYSDIFVMNANGSGVTQLTDGTELLALGYTNLLNWFPSWSPDGSKIVFESINYSPLGNIAGELFVMNASGGGWNQLTVADPTLLNGSTYYPDESPAWSPNGNKIAFMRSLPGQQEIFTINPNGSGMTQLTGIGVLTLDYNRTPAWSPDGTKIAYEGPNAHLFVMNADGSGQADLTPSTAATNPSWHSGTVIESPVITSANATAFKVGTSDSFNITTVGNPTITSITQTGTLPNGINFTDYGNGAAVIWGIPAQGTGGVYPITIKASNGINPDASQPFTLTVNESPSITSANATAFKVGTAGTFTVTTTAFPVAAIARTGALPTGVNFVDNGNGTATLSGTPAAGTAGSYPISITASNGVLPDAVQSFTLTVNQPPAITSANATTFQVGVAGSFTVTTTGAPTAASITKAGSLPSGVTFTNNGDGTATIAGTPDPATDGSYPISITASNGIAPDAVQPFTLTVTSIRKARGQLTSD